MLSASLTGFDEAIAHALADLDDATDDAMTAAAQVVATEAQRRHAYQNRTGTLESMTLAGEAGGSFLDGTAYGEVIADTDYAEYLEDPRYMGDRYAFLLPAWERCEARAEAAALRVVERAVGRF